MYFPFSDKAGAPPETPGSFRERAFTIVELLAVITIMAVIAGLVGPSVIHFRKGDAIAAAGRQTLDAVARARQLAISEHTTVYMVFVPVNFWMDIAYANNPSLTEADRIAATNLLDKQLTGYAFVSLRTVGDQPGRPVPRYLSSWQTLPNGAFIASDKFNVPRYDYLTNLSLAMTNLYSARGLKAYGFDVTTNIPFPLATTQPFLGAAPQRPYPGLPYIAFDYLGRLVSVVSGQHGECIPLAQGSVHPVTDVNKLPFMPTPSPGPGVREIPPGNSVASYNVVYIDRLTGRARLERQEVQ